ncbi:hypothetical protein NKG05_05660 [Oerskovia sp. M15]
MADGAGAASGRPPRTTIPPRARRGLPQAEPGDPVRAHHLEVDDSRRRACAHDRAMYGTVRDDVDTQDERGVPVQHAPPVGECRSVAGRREPRRSGSSGWRHTWTV